MDMLFSDMSFLSRLRKIYIVLNELNALIEKNIFYLFIPITFANLEVFWVDNVLVSSLVIIGPFFSIMLILYLLLIFLKHLKFKNYSILIYLILVIFGNLSTEFILVSNGAFITLGQYFLLKEMSIKKQCKLKYK